MLVGSDGDDGDDGENCQEMAVRDEDGIWEQSRWFWAMRGEEEDEQPAEVEMNVNGSGDLAMEMGMM